MKFENVVKVEGDRTIPMTEKYLHSGPMSMAEIEYFEDQVISQGLNYLLVQADTVIDLHDKPGLYTPEGVFYHQQRYMRGYCLFVRLPNKKYFKKN